MSLSKLTTPKKRLASECINMSPSKIQKARKPVSVMAVVCGDNKTAVIYCLIPGNPGNEPYTNPAWLAVMSTEQNTLRKAGFFMVATLSENNYSGKPHMTDRGYSYKAYVVVTDENLMGTEGTACLNQKTCIFCDVSTIFDN